jgi:hypothetical protein
MSGIGLLAGLQFQTQRLADFSPWQMLKFLASITTPLQWGEFAAWGTITGILIATGVSAASVHRSRAWAVLAAAALVPIGLVLLAHQLNRIWPNTARPTEVPIMALLLALYSLVIPWLLGRGLARCFATYRKATEQPSTINQ